MCEQLRVVTSARATNTPLNNIEKDCSLALTTSLASCLCTSNDKHATLYCWQSFPVRSPQGSMREQVVEVTEWGDSPLLLVAARLTDCAIECARTIENSFDATKLFTQHFIKNVDEPSCRVFYPLHSDQKIIPIRVFARAPKIHNMWT